MGFREYLTGFAVGFVSSAIVSFSLTNIASQQRTFVDVYSNVSKFDCEVTGDLNMDGVPDMVVEQKGRYKIPMYCVERDTELGREISYVSASVMQERNPGSVIDYRAIERQLNEKR
ncbi:MAG: hypothetical protein ABIF88_04000 [archaeon]